MNALDHAINSNMHAAIAYNQDFDSLEDYAQMDLAMADADCLKLPVLLNGSNQYATISENHSFKLDNAKFKNILDKDSLFIVIPETGNILEKLITEQIEYGNAVNAAMNSNEHNILFAHELFNQFSNKSDLLRIYDSHLSVFAYEQVVKASLARLGVDTSVLDVDYEYRDYIPDLASRLSSKIVPSVFPSEKHLVNEDLYDDKLRGIWRSFSNKNARVNKTLLLVGDSHSYSCMAQMFAHVFTRVEFFWESRANEYGARKAQIEDVVNEADFVIEESAERFFLNNYGSTR